MRRILIILVLAVLAGCDGGGSGEGDEGGGTATPDTQSTPPESTPSADEGCPSEQPLELTLSPKYAVLVEACSSEDGTSLSVKNVSSAVLNVWSIGPSEPDFAVEPSDDKSLSAAAIQTTVESYKPSQGVLLAPDARVVASDYERVELDVAFVGDVTWSAFAARVVTEMVEEKLKSPGQQLAGSVAKCAESVAAVYKSGLADTWPAALGNAVARAPDCVSLTRQVDDAVNAPPRPPARVAAEFASVADNVKTSAWDEALKLAGRVIRVAGS